MRKDLVMSIIGLLFGLVLIDADHILDYAFLHWVPVVIGIFFFGVGLFIFNIEKKKTDFENGIEMGLKKYV